MEQWNVGHERDGNRTRIFLGRSESSWVEVIAARKVKICGNFSGTWACPPDPDFSRYTRYAATTRMNIEEF